MDDLERRLRAALRSVSEPPPPGLLVAVRRRHTRHVRRVGLSCVAAVAGIAVAAAPVVHALGPPAAATLPVLPGPGSVKGSFPVRPAPPGPPPPSAVKGKVLRDCDNNNNGTLGSHWEKYSVHAGPVWFIYAREPAAFAPSRRLAGGKLNAQAEVVAISNGASAVVSVAPGQRAHFRFLAAFDSSNRYTLRDGQPGLKLAGCPALPPVTGIPDKYAPGLTMFWQGYVTDLRSCLRLEVRRLPAGRVIHVTLPGPAHRCRR